MQQITDYKVIQTTNVQVEIAEGWQPYGDPFSTASQATSASPVTITKWQAVVKYSQPVTAPPNTNTTYSGVKYS